LYHYRVKSRDASGNLAASGDYSFTTLAQSVGTYYVSAAGSDSNDGLSTATPWKTIAKVNAKTFVSGDKILFRSGDDFSGQINLNQAGVTLGAYGAGAKPIISGTEHLAGWTAYGSFYVAQASARVKNLFSNGVQMTMARYPNSGFLPVATTNGTTTLTAAGVNQASGYWTGANLRLRSSDFTFETRTVTSYNGTTLSIASSPDYGVKVGWGFYLDNVLAALDAPGEWYCDPATNKVYFWAPGGVNPGTLTVDASTLDYGVNSAQSNITVQGLEFRYQANTAVRFSGSVSNVKVLANTVFGSLISGIQFSGAASCTVDGNTVQDICGRGITLSNASNSTVSNNIVKNIGLVDGYGYSGGDGMTGIHTAGGNNNLISGNNLDSIGYNGIRGDGKYNTIEHNTITNSMLRLADGGAIYTFNWQHTEMSFGSIIRNNTISNVIGGIGGEPAGTTWRQAHGIYLDFASHDMIVTSNTISHVDSSCFFMQYEDYKNTFTYNTLFDCGKGPGGYGIFMEQHPSSGYYGQHTVKYNRFLSASSTQQYLIRVVDDGSGVQPASLGAFDYNYYANPYNKTSQFMVGIGGAYNYYSLAQWQAAMGQDAHSSATDPSPSDTTPPSISVVAATSISSGSAVISWSTNEAADTQVEFGPTTAYGQQSAWAAAMIVSHSVGISGLSASTLYHYRVRSRDAAGNLAISGDSSFTTSAAVQISTGLPSWTGAGATIPVAAGADIQAAINAASSGDTISLADGTWTGVHLTINKKLRLKAQNPLGARLQGYAQPTDGADNGIMVTGAAAAGTFIQGLDVRWYGGNSIDVSATGNVVISGCHIESNGGQGILLWDTVDVMVFGNTIHDPYLAGMAPTLVDDSSSTNWMNNNNLVLMDYGIQVSGTVRTQVVQNYFYGQFNQTVSFREGNRDYTVKDNTFEGFAGSAILFGQNIAVYGPYAYSGQARSLDSGTLRAEGNILRPAVGYQSAQLAEYRGNSAIRIGHLNQATVYVSSNIVEAAITGLSVDMDVNGSAGGPTGILYADHNIINGNLWDDGTMVSPTAKVRTVGNWRAVQLQSGVQMNVVIKNDTYANFSYGIQNSGMTGTLTVDRTVFLNTNVSLQGAGTVTNSIFHPSSALSGTGNVSA
ncbi:MAG: right-handed parallel beta-helix repeat-containing protein, partial [Elusimicrobiota bacterium]